MNTSGSSAQHIVFGWWNTGVSHPKQTPDKHEKRLCLTKEVVKKLSVQGVDFLALGEVSDEDIDRINDASLDLGYHAIKAAKKEGRLQFDLGFLYNREKFIFVEKKFLTVSWTETKTLKTAVRIDMLPAAGDKPFVIFASHWLSDLTFISPEAKREELGRALRRSIDELFSDFGIDGVYIIVMGDFNEEPFSQALSENLCATRDRGMLIRKKTLLYNPFWRHLGETRPFDLTTPVSDNVCGTHFSNTGELTRWRVIDQMMFSSSFISSREWFLNKRYSSIWTEHPLNFDALKKNELDHFPVISAVTFNS